jgi:hypothetical protein
MSFGYRKALVSQQADGPTLTAAAAATCLHAASKKTLAANFYEVFGHVLAIKAAGRISCAVTTPGTARFDVRFGGTVVFDSLAIPLNIVAKTNVPFELEIFMSMRTVGSAANFMGWGRFASEAVVGSPLPSVGGSGVIQLPYNVAPAVGGNFDATVSQLVDLFFTQTVATGSLTLHQYLLEAPTWE